MEPTIYGTQYQPTIYYNTDILDYNQQQYENYFIYIYVKYNELHKSHCLKEV